jgi:hypothetical protein
MGHVARLAFPDEEMYMIAHQAVCVQAKRQFGLDDRKGFEKPFVIFPFLEKMAVVYSSEDDVIETGLAESAW